MPFTISSLWTPPTLNPVTGKARSIPILNPIDRHSRAFFFSWFAFILAYFSWYAFPPLLNRTLKQDLHLTDTQIANSNIATLVSTLLARILAGPACDYFGPRFVFVACLLLGALPSALAGLATNPRDLIIIRFFIGILGGVFVPCQVWVAAFFDPDAVGGAAAAIAAGWGNAGAGLAYFALPALVDNFTTVHHLSLHLAWRIAVILPAALVILVAVAILVLVDDCPAGKWSDRHRVVQENIAYCPKPEVTTTTTPAAVTTTIDSLPSHQQCTDVAVVQNPTVRRTLHVVLSPQTAVLSACYLCSFGAELAINTILGAFYLQNFPRLGQAAAGRRAALFGLLNLVSRPFGGILSDFLYHVSGAAVWPKKLCLHVFGVLAGVFQIVIGLLDPSDSNNKHHHGHHSSSAAMMGLVAAIAISLQAGSGACFSIVPHVHPSANGVLSGLTGAAGNLGGILFAVIFRYQGADFARTFWIIGIITIAINLLASWVKPLPAPEVDSSCSRTAPAAEASSSETI